MKTFFTLLLVAIGLGASAQPYQIMTYNIRYNNIGDGDHAWPYRKDKVANIIQRADIAGLQEVLNGMMKDLDKRMKGFAHVGVGRDNGKTKGEYAPIYYKKDLFTLLESSTFWLSENPAAVGKKGWDADCVRICTWAKLKDKNTGKEFFVFNTHFDHKGKIARAESAKLIAQKIAAIAGDMPYIFTGDLNSTINDEAYISLHQSGLIDVNYTAVKRTGPEYSDCGFNVSNKKCSKIDYIFMNNKWKALSHNISDEHEGEYYPSDHLPVSAELQLL